MQLRIAVLRSELQRQRKALGREIDLQQKEKSQLQKKGRVSIFFFFDLFTCLLSGCLLPLIQDWKSEESKREFLFVWVTC